MKIIKKTTGESILPYIAYIPENCGPKPALIVHLHGAGERGNGDNELEKVLVHGFPKIVNDQNLQDCVLVMPQCPTGSFWTAKLESLRSFIDELIGEYDIDTGRIYLCGLSMGGYGTWHAAMAYPELFAAIAPCCGGGMAWNTEVLTMPIWTFHGLSDTVVSPNQTIEMIESLKARNANLKYDLYEGVGHNSWEKAFSEELLRWLLEQHK